MANCHDLFQEYHKTIKLSASKKELLRKGRNSLRKIIKNFFKENLKIKEPKFWSQGSYALKTIVNPINGDYDIDDGVYLQSIDNNNWPSPISVHKWVYNAVKDHTKDNPVDKNNCVRVVYAGDYHIDLPIYIVHNEECYLAKKNSNSWDESNPKKIYDWFMDKLDENTEQLRTIIKYLKAWADFQTIANDIKLPSGFILTVLVAENYEYKDRDDAAFGRTIRNIYRKLNNNFLVYNPVNQNEILTNRLTEKQKKDFFDLIAKLRDSSNRALDNINKKESCKIWRKEFGERFPKCEDINDENDELLITKAPAILKDDARSA